jgi:biopolymer transport protein ExbD
MLTWERTSRRRLSVQTSLIALVDVLLILVLFFVLVMGTSQTQALKTSITSKKSSALPEKAMIVLVGEQGKLSLDNVPVTAQSLSTTLAETFRSDPERPVVVMSAKNVPVQALISTMDMLTQVGAKRVTLSGGELR